VVGALVFLASAQNDSKLPTLHRAPTDTNTNVSQPKSASVVHVFLTVHDKKNKALADLAEEDLTIADDGQPQHIQQFSKAAGQPLRLGLLVDTSPGQHSMLTDERTATRSFVDQMVRADLDKAFVIHFDHEVELLQDATASHAKLEQAIDGLNTAQFVRTSGGQSGNPSDDDDSQTAGRGSGRRLHNFGGAQLYDAIYLASNELMQKQSGRKVVVVLSSGVDRGSKESLPSAVEAAQRANTIVYAIFVQSERENQSREHGGRTRGGWGGIPGMGGPMGGPGVGRHGGRGQQQENRLDGKKILEQISSETGGQMFEASKKLTVAQIYSLIEDQLHNQYAIAYTPGHESETADLHKLQVTAKKKDVVVLAPAAYYFDIR